MKRTSKMVTNPSEVEYFVKNGEELFTKTSFIMKTFGMFKGNPPKYNPFDLIKIPPNSYGKEGKKNKNEFLTSLGLWVFNKAFIEPHLFDVVGYVNTPITSKVMDNLNEKISYAVMEDRVPLDTLKDYLMKWQKFQPYCDILCWSFTENMFMSTAKIDIKKEQLLKKYEKEIKAGDPIAVDTIQKELLAYAKDDVLEGDPSMDLFNSGAKGSFNNNYKNMFVIRGAIKDPDPTKGYDIVTSSYMDGIQENEYSIMAKSLAAGPYSRNKKTQYGGYMEKLFLRSLQHLVLLDPGTDCGTHHYLEVELTPKLAEQMIYSYIVEGNKLVELTSQNMNKYIGKKVKFRFSAFCESKDGICSKCAGNMFYRLGIRNVGAATPQIASKLKLKAMKAFHDAQVKLHEMDLSKAFPDE